MPMSEEPVAVPPVAEPQVLGYQHGSWPRVPPEWTHVRVYGYREEALREATRHWMVLQAAISAPSIVLGVGVVMYYSDWTFRSAVPTLMIMMGILVGMLLMKLWRISRRMRAQWPTFRLVLSDQGLMRTCLGYPDILIEHAHITKISETPKLLSVRGKSPRHVIYIHRLYVDGAEEIRGFLAARRPIEPIQRVWMRVAGKILLILVLAVGLAGLFGLGMYTTDPLLEVACVGGLTVYVTWSLWVTWRNPNVPTVQKVGMLMTILFPLMVLAKVALRGMSIP
jgi:hypothetical protein